MIRQINQVPDASGAGYYNPCSGALSIVMPQESVNQIKNPSFELYEDENNSAFTGWEMDYIVHPSITLIPTTIVDISNYIGYTPWSGARAFDSFYTNQPSSQLITLRYEYVSIVSGRYYAFSFYTRGGQDGSGPQSTFIQGRPFTATASISGTTIASKSFTLISGQWQRVELVFRAASTSSQVALQITKDTNLTIGYGGGRCFIDAVQFEQLSTVDNVIGNPVPSLHATTYFDGDSTGLINGSTGIIEYAWRGRPHRSESVRSGQTAAGGRIYNLQDEFGLEIIGIAEAGMSQPQVQSLTFNSQDGGSLQDIINPIRTVTLIGQVHGADKIDLARKLQRLTALVSRDIVQYRQDRKFIFQHKDGFENIGVPMTFTGTFASGLNVMATNALSANVDISIQMHDPYFYGHDEGLRLTEPDKGYGGLPDSMLEISPYGIDSRLLLMQRAPSAQNVNGVFHCIAEAPNGDLWVGGSFTSPHPYIMIYSRSTNSWSAVPGASLNAQVWSIKFSPDGLAWIGGEFTGANGNHAATHNGLTWINAASNNFNNVVYGIEIVNLGQIYEVYAVGAFTTIPAGSAFRIARRISSAGAWSAYGTGSGFNDITFSITYSIAEDALYAGGRFAATQGGAVACVRVARIQRSTGATTALTGGSPNADVTALMIDGDGSLVIGGEFTTPSPYIAYALNQVVYRWPVPNAIVVAGQVTINGLFKYRDGIFAGIQKSIPSSTTSGFRTDLPSISYWNGSARLGTAWVPVGGGGLGRYVGIELSDGTLYLGLRDTSTDEWNPVISKALNTSTVQAYPTIRCQFGVNGRIQMVSILNVYDNKSLLFSDRLDVSSTGFMELDFISRDIVMIKPKENSVESTTLGSVLRAINPSASFGDFTIRPGSVGLSLIVNAVRGITGYNVEVYWPQTFQSIFDGAYRS